MYTTIRGDGKGILFQTIMDEASFEELLRIQNRMASLVAREAETDTKIKILTIIDEITGQKKKKVQVEHLIIEATNQGMTEKEVTDTLDKLKTDGLLAEPERGYVIKT